MVEIPLTRTRWFALACLILAMALWGSSYVVLKVAFRELPPLWVIFGRMALGSLVFLVAWRWRGRIDYRPGDWKYLLGLDLAVPDHSTLSRRANTLMVPRLLPRRSGEPLHLLVDSTGLKLCGKGECLLEKHGTATRRSWRMLHPGVDAGTGRIVASTLTPKDADNASQVGPLQNASGYNKRARVEADLLRSQGRLDAAAAAAVEAAHWEKKAHRRQCQTESQRRIRASVRARKLLLRT